MFRNDTLVLTTKRANFLLRIQSDKFRIIPRVWLAQYKWARTVGYVVYDDDGVLVLTDEAKEHLKCRK